MPFEELFIASNNKYYKHKYFVAYTDMNDIMLDSYQKSEVSKMEWKTLDQCLESIRPYNLEKKNIILNIDNVLNNYILY